MSLSQLAIAGVFIGTCLFALSGCADGGNPAAPVVASEGGTKSGRIASAHYYNAGGWSGPSSVNGHSSSGGHSDGSTKLTILCYSSPMTCYSVSGPNVWITEGPAQGDPTSNDLYKIGP